MRKICVVVTARASYARIRTVLLAIQAHPDLQLQLVVSGSAVLTRFGDIISVMASDGLVPDERVFMVVEGENLTTSAKSTGLALIELATVFDNLKPDIVVSIADRYETLATSVCASYMNIPLAHVQGGEVTGSIDEKVRHASTKLADLHFASTARSRDWIIRMGENPESVFHTGCPSIDIAAEIARSPALDFDPMEKYGGVGHLDKMPERYIVVMQHPVTTQFGAGRQQMVETLEAVAAVDIPVLWFWPNIDAGSDDVSNAIRSFRENNELPNFRFFKNMKPMDFMRLLVNSQGIVGNSSVGIRECSYLGVPTVNIGVRQLNRERGGNVIDVEHDREAIREAIETMLASPRPEGSPIYGDGDAGERIANLLASTNPGFEKRLHYVYDA
ncbi:MAG: UDP-N-acetylglucosamine 2-epimerase [Gammaproteobacteria bacterium]